MPDSFQIRVCEEPDCGLRYPLVVGQPHGERCPLCLGSTHKALTHDLPKAGPERSDNPELKLEALLDNIRSAWNVGAIFRTADGLGVKRLYLCGITPTPDDPALKKTALGAEHSLPWEYARNALHLAEKLKTSNHELVALEQDPRALPLAKFQTDKTGARSPILVLGNEVTGVDPDLLDLCDHILQIPMLGRKRSLNVEVVFGIAAFTLSRQFASSVTKPPRD